MIKHDLERGDMLLTRDGPAILLRKTKSYWYYFYKNHNCRVSIPKLWNLLDTSSSLRVNYGSDLKNRKKKRKQRTLDLHSTRHSEVDEKLRKFLNFVELPAFVLTGNSEKMKNIVEKVVTQYGWHCTTDPSNTGRVMIFENSV